MIHRTACLIGQSDDIFRNQAVEMQLMESLPDETAILFLHESSLAVSQGRLEDSQEVCREQLLREAGGKLARRVSGGRAHFISEGVLSYSLILPKEDFHLPRQMTMLGAAFASLGVSASAGKNASFGCMGRCFCRGSFHKGAVAAVHHGVIDCDVDYGKMALYLTNKSAEQAVCLHQLCRNASVQDMEEALFYSLGRIYGSEPVWLDERMLDKPSLFRYEERFRARSWTERTASGSGFRVSECFPWGSVTVLLQEENGLIRGASVFTDAFETAWFEMLEKSLIGAPFLISSISGRLSQRMEGLRDPRLRQITGDVITLICGHIKQSNRQGLENGRI